MLEQLQLAVCALRQDRSAEGLHDLLDCHGLAGELILGRAAPRQHARPSLGWANIPDKAKGSHTDGLQVSVPLRGQCRSCRRVGPRRTCL
jgi:hypothetical protein